MGWWHELVGRGADRVGGRSRAIVILTLAGVFALDGADLGAIGAMAVPMQHSLGISKAELGLLLTASLGMGALATLPFGILIDRYRRTRVLTWAILEWGAAMLLSGTATSYGYLLVTRLFLGAGTACAAPAVASLVGDYFMPEERGKIYGYVLSGDLIGTAIGFLCSGEIASWSWRAGLIVLGPPALLLAWAVHRLPEPERGGGSRLRDESDHRPVDEQAPRTLEDQLREAHVQPRERLLLPADPRACSFWWSVKYVLRIPTNLVLIVGSALAYFYLAGLRGFAIEYLHLRYGVSHALSILLALLLGIGAIVGVLIGGGLADRLLHRGHVRARVAVAIVAYFLTVAFLVPGLLVGAAWLAMILFALGAAGLGAIDPPLDGARLDIMVPSLWGRAEAVRVFLRKTAEAGAPFAFGLIADGYTSGPDHGHGLEVAFLAMLAVLVVAGLIAAISLRTYPRDVVTAEANRQRQARAGASARPTAPERTPDREPA